MDGNFYYTAHCRDDKSCGRSCCWLLVPRQEIFKNPEPGILEVVLFEIEEKLEEYFVIRLFDSFSEETVFRLEILPHLTKRHLEKVMVELFHFTVMSNELYSGLSLWFASLQQWMSTKYGNPEEFIDTGLDWVRKAFFSNEIGCATKEAGETLAGQIEIWLKP